MRSTILSLLLLSACGGAPFTATDHAAADDAGHGAESAPGDDALGLVQAPGEAGSTTGDAVVEGSGGSSSSSSSSSGGVSESGSGSSSSSSGGGSSSSSGSVGSTCTPGATQCASDTQVETCGTDGQWGAAMMCGARQRCTGQTGSAACTCNVDPVCTSALNVCATSSAVANCVQNDSGCFYEGSTTTCVNQTCVAGACVGVCGPGQTGCDGNAPETCGTSGQWVSGTACSAVTTCVSGTCTGVCGPGQSICYPASGDLVYCGPDGQWPLSGSTRCNCGSNGACI
jgi:hypothetical protein